MSLIEDYDQQHNWFAMCGDLEVFDELLVKLASGKPYEKRIGGFLKPLRRTRRNFYKWLKMHPEAKGLISAKLIETGPTMAILAFGVNLRRETRGRRPK